VAAERSAHHLPKRIGLRLLVARALRLFEPLAGLFDLLAPALHLPERAVRIELPFIARCADRSPAHGGALAHDGAYDRREQKAQDDSDDYRNRRVSCGIL